MLRYNYYHLPQNVSVLMREYSRKTRLLELDLSAFTYPKNSDKILMGSSLIFRTPHMKQERLLQNQSHEQGEFMNRKYEITPMTDHLLHESLRMKLL